MVAWGNHAASALRVFAFENKADFRRQFALGERFLQKVNSRVQASMVQDGVFRVTGHVEDFNLRPQAQNFLGELRTIHSAWQHDVDQQQCDARSIADCL